MLSIKFTTLHAYYLIYNMLFNCNSDIVYILLCLQLFMLTI